MKNDALIPVFDAHFHILDPRFPLIENQGYAPPPFTPADYREAIRSLPMQDLKRFQDHFSGEEQERIFWLNARAWYRLNPETS